MFIKILRKSSLNKIFLLLICIIAGWALLRFPEAASTGISRGLSIATHILIPSLFPFLVLSAFMVKAGLNQAVGRRLEGVTHFLFGLPGSCAGAILMSFVGGYPAGSIAVNELLDKGVINKNQARNMLSFTVNAGPAFIISGVGAAMLGNVKLGIFLYIAHLSASFIIGLALRKQNKSYISDKAYPKEKKPSISAAFVDSIEKACNSMLLMCGFLVIFTALLSVMDGSGLSHAILNFSKKLKSSNSGSSFLPQLIKTAIPAFLEVSSGSIEASSSGIGGFAPLLIGMTLGWGGLSVHCQVAATLRGKGIITARFFFYRLVHSLLGGIISAMFFQFIPFSIPTINSNSSPSVYPHSINAFGTGMLVLLCIIFLLSIGSPQAEDKQQ